MDRKEALLHKLEARFHLWQARLSEVKAKAEGATAEQRVLYHEQMEDLKEKADAASEQLNRLQVVGEGAWEEMKLGVEMAVEDFKGAVQRAADTLRH